jgi:hypothetical protein
MGVTHSAVGGNSVSGFTPDPGPAATPAEEAPGLNGCSVKQSQPTAAGDVERVSHPTITIQDERRRAATERTLSPLWGTPPGA